MLSFKHCSGTGLGNYKFPFRGPTFPTLCNIFDLSYGIPAEKKLNNRTDKQIMPLLWAWFAMTKPVQTYSWDNNSNHRTNSFQRKTGPRTAPNWKGFGTRITLLFLMFSKECYLPCLFLIKNSSTRNPEMYWSQGNLKNYCDNCNSFVWITETDSNNNPVSCSTQDHGMHFKTFKVL